jgi:hypothetical protein
MGSNFGHGPFTEALRGLEKLPLALAKFQWGFFGHVPAALQSVNWLARANVLALRDHVKLVTNRSTDVVDKSFVRVDVTDEFPFLVTNLSTFGDR